MAASPKSDNRGQGWLVAALLAVLLWTGCAGDGRAKSTPAKTRPAAVKATAPPRLSKAEMERRVDANAHYAAGVVYDVQSEPRLAEDQFRAAIKADPRHEQLAVDLAQRYLQNRQPTNAVATLLEVSREPGASGQVFGWLGTAYVQADNRPAAITAFREAMKRAPQSILGYHGLAQLYLREKQTNEALAVLDAGAALKDASAAFLVDLAGFEIAASRQRLLPSETTKPRALALLDRAGRLNPTEPQVLERMAEGYKVLGETQRATTLYEGLLKTFPPTNLGARLSLREQLFRLYVRNGDRANARLQLEGIERDNPSNPQVQFMLGLLAMEEKRFPDAQGHFEKAILLEPTMEPAYYELAGSLLSQQDAEGALEVLDKARGRFKAGFVLEFYSGVSHAALKQYTEAVNHLGAAELHAKVAEPTRLNDGFYFQMGSANERAGRYEDAVAALRKCLELDPNNAEALNYLGYMWAERGENLDEARTMIEKALKQEPDSPAFLDSLAWVLFKQGKPAEALEAQLKAVKLIPKPDATLLDHLGDIYQALGRTAEAREAWRKSLAIEANPVVEKKLDPPAAKPAP